MSTPIPPLEMFLDDARAWLDDHAQRAVTDEHQKFVWGQGDFSVSVFHALRADDERALLERVKSWTQAKAERGVPRRRRTGRVRRPRVPRGTPRRSPDSSGSTSVRGATRRTASRPG